MEFSLSPISRQNFRAKSARQKHVVPPGPRFELYPAKARWWKPLPSRRKRATLMRDNGRPVDLPRRIGEPAAAREPGLVGGSPLRARLVLRRGDAQRLARSRNGR